MSSTKIVLIAIALLVVGGSVSILHAGLYKGYPAPKSAWVFYKMNKITGKTYICTDEVGCRAYKE